MGKNNGLTHGVLMKVLEWAYSRSLGGFTGVDSAYVLAESYLKGEGTLEEKVDNLIKWQVAKSATSGFVTGFGGLITIPFTIPANVASVIYIQVRMITAIAYMGGYDVRDDKVKTLIYISMAGNGAKEFLKGIGVKVGEKMLTNFAKKLSAQALTSVNNKLGYKLLTKLGTKGVANLGKAIPIMGGIVSGAFDAASTKAVGVAAKKIFIKNENDEIEIIES